MAINHLVEQPGSIDATDLANYPFGKAQDETPLTPGVGTAWVQRLINDILGFQQYMLTQAGTVPSGNPETINASQYGDALESIITNHLASAPILNDAQLTGTTEIDLSAMISSTGPLEINEGGTSSQTPLDAFDAIVPDATTLQRGAVIISDQTNVDAGIDPDLTVSPLTLRNTPLIRPFAGSIPQSRPTLENALIAGEGISFAQNIAQGRLEVNSDSPIFQEPLQSTTITLGNFNFSTLLLGEGVWYVRSESTAFAGQLQMQLLENGVWMFIDNGDFLTPEPRLVVSSGVNVRFRLFDSSGPLIERQARTNRVMA